MNLQQNDDRIAQLSCWVLYMTLCSAKYEFLEQYVNVQSTL